jgi:RNA polymerase sigma-70 factor (ECF subfamily)
MRKVQSSRREKFEKDSLPHLDALWSTAQWLTMRHSYAEDLVVRTFTRAYRSWHDSVGPVGSKARLLRILIREFSDDDVQKRKSGRFLPERRDPAADGDNGGRQYPVAAIDRQQLSMLTRVPDVFVRGTIAHLRPQSRLIMILLHLEGFSYADIAYITDLRKNSVRSILARLHKLIPQYLIEHPKGFVAVAGSRNLSRLHQCSSDSYQKRCQNEQCCRVQSEFSADAAVGRLENESGSISDGDRG